MAIVPFATQMLIPPGSSDPRINARIGILHVDAGNAESLYDFFKNRSGGIESHGHIQKTGVLEQYRGTDWQADANFHANDFATSWESQGFGIGLWTEEQLSTIKRLILWHKRRHSIPLRKVTSWNDPRGGWGYHTLFGSPSPWTPVAKSCPGPDRIKQFHTILVPWMEAGGPIDDGNPTPRITEALKADTVEKRKIALRRIINASPSDEAQQIAARWLKVTIDIEAAKAQAKELRVDLKNLEIKA